ncbi:uncharacterized protein F4822DRAFT_431257 [Hypoxylon trugodes]|uniref:uncharacterized protein n=1 Tax=Hypoxylon trugodes TaxID=326681 RepID=UPI002195B4F2|nr:uncharacterized protein F4822DRAFT_431257 [Hypoxylon trugodes]KAI1386386.1 hypothetical protein F4822DRAFT_431257 [Hypoxylon trugodes]
MAMKIATSTLKRLVSNVEVERKFNPGPNFFSYLANHVWDTNQALRARGPFTVIKCPGQLIRDTYYDTEDHRLSGLGLWVRRRDVRTLPTDSPHALAQATSTQDEGQWNAKSRLAGHYNNSQFVELDGKAKVSQEVLRITEMRTKLEDLQIVSDLLTNRSIWEVKELMDGVAPSANMTIVLDAVTEAEAKTSEDGSDGHDVFNHTIGEVELFEEVITEDMENQEHKAHRKEIAAQRMKELEQFISAHPDLFSTNPKPIGKLTAYDMWRAAHSRH